MTNWRQIAAMPTELTREAVENHAMERDRDIGLYWSSRAPVAWHESLFRAFHIVEEVKRLLELETPPSVIRQAIDAMEG